jgi:HPt (histidine-containing phosphotransfer) domain-containing protein
MLQSELSVAKLYDLSSLETLSGNDHEFVRMMAKLFADTVPETIFAIEKAVETARWKEVGACAHKLKSAIDTMQITSLALIIRKIEKDGKNECDTCDIPQLVVQVTTILRKCIHQITTEFRL